MIPEQPTEAEVKALLCELPERTKAHEMIEAIRKATNLIKKAQIIEAADEIKKALE